MLGIDLAASMLRLAEQNVRRAGLSASISLEFQDAKALPYSSGAFRCVISNTILHHIPDPALPLREMVRVLGPGGLLFVRDLIRPDTDAEVQALCERYAAGANAHQRALLDASLRAAFTIEEVQRMVASYGVPTSAIRQTSDRHWTLIHRIGGDRA